MLAMLADGANMLHISEVFIVIQGIANHKFIRDFKSNIMRGIPEKYLVVMRTFQELEQLLLW